MESVNNLKKSLKNFGVGVLASSMLLGYGCTDRLNNPFKNRLDTQEVMQFLSHNSSEENDEIIDVIRSEYNYIKGNQDLLEIMDYPELTLSAHVLDILDLHKELGQDYKQILVDNPSMINSTTRHLIRISQDYNKSYEDIVNYLGIHNSINPFLNAPEHDFSDLNPEHQKRKRTRIVDDVLSQIVNTQEQFFKLDSDNFYDAQSVTQELAKRSVKKDFYNEIITPATDLLSIIENEDYKYFDDVFKGNELNFPGREKLSNPAIVMNYFIDLTSDITANAIDRTREDKEKLHERYRSPERIGLAVQGVMNSILENAKNYKGLESKIYETDETRKDERIKELVQDNFYRADKALLMLFEQFPNLKDPHSYANYTNEIIEKDVPINALKKAVIESKETFSKHKPGLDFEPSKILNDAYRLLEDLTLQNFESDENLELENDEYRYYKHVLNKIPLVSEEMSKFEMDGKKYVPVKQIENLIQNIRASCDRAELPYTTKIAQDLNKSLVTIGNFIDKEDYCGNNVPYKLHSIAQLNNLEELLDEAINNSVFFTIEMNQLGLDSDSAIDYLKFFEANTQKKEQLAYPVKNSLITMEAGLNHGWSVNAQKKLLLSLKSAGKEVTRQSQDYLNPEKMANAMVTTISSVNVSDLSAYDKIINYLSDLSNRQPGFARHIAAKDVLDPNEFGYAGIRAINNMKSSNQSLTQILNRAKKEYKELSDLKTDMKERPFLHRNRLDIGYITPEKISLEMEKKKQDNYFLTSTDPILAVYKKMIPDSNVHRLISDKPNIAQVNIDKYKTNTQHLSNSQRIDALTAVFNLSLTKSEFDGINFNKIHTDMTGKTYQEASIKTDLFTDHLFSSAIELAGMKYLKENANRNGDYFNDALDYLHFINRECKDDRFESRLLYVALTKEVLDKGYEVKGFMPNQLKSFANELIKIPEDTPNQSKFTPSVIYNFRSVNKISNALISWIDSDKTSGQEMNDLFYTLYFTKVFSYNCEKKIDPNSYLIPATHFYHELKNLFTSNDDNLGDRITDYYKTKRGVTNPSTVLIDYGTYILDEANNPPVSYPKPDKLGNDAINIINDIKDRKYGLFPN